MDWPDAKCCLYCAERYKNTPTSAELDLRDHAATLFCDVSSRRGAAQGRKTFSAYTDMQERQSNVKDCLLCVMGQHEGPFTYCFGSFCANADRRATGWETIAEVLDGGIPEFASFELCVL